jgi:hypothetical protein
MYIYSVTFLKSVVEFWSSLKANFRDQSYDLFTYEYIRQELWRKMAFFKTKYAVYAEKIITTYVSMKTSFPPQKAIPNIGRPQLVCIITYPCTYLHMYVKISLCFYVLGLAEWRVS